MLVRRGNLLSRLPARPSFAGRNLMERMRSTAFALLGTTAALALGLVALAAHQGWPFLPVGPIPAYQADRGAVGKGVALEGDRADVAAARGAGGPSSARRGGRRLAESDSGLSASREIPAQLAAPGAAPPPPGSEVATPPSQPPSPGSPPAALPAGVAPPPVPVAAPAPASSPSPAPAAPSAPVDPPAVTSSSPGKGHAYGRQKSAAAPPAKPPKAPKPAPPASPSPPPPVAAEPGGAAEPEPPVPAGAPADGPGGGKGHAYGHDK